jgi:hypothetical protein
MFSEKIKVMTLRVAKTFRESLHARKALAGWNNRTQRPMGMLMWDESETN